jgi:PASTA domain
MPKLMLIVVLVAAVAPSLAWGGVLAPHPPPPPAAPATVSGTLSVCSTSGARPVTGSLVYTMAAPASAGGVYTFSVAVGTCSPPVFFPQGTAVIVTENVPAGDAVTSIALAGGASTLSVDSPASGSGTVLIASGASTITFTTSGPVTTSSVPRDCKVPYVVGLGLTAAKAAIVKASCTVGVVRRAYSASIRTGRVLRESPKRGTVLAHGAPVDLLVSRGPRP